MFRVTTKLTSQNCLLKNYVFNTPRIRQTLRFIQNKNDPLCPPPKKSANTGSMYTVGALTVVGLATIGYAKYDYEFRQMITDNIPYSEGFFKFIFQEDKTYYEQIVGAFGGLFGAITSSEERLKAKSQLEDKKDYIPPRPVFPALAKEDKKEEKFSEIRIAQTPDKVEIVSEKPKHEEDKFISPTHPKSLSELEEKIGQETKTAIEAYSNALNAVRLYNREIETIVEQSVEKLDPKIWDSLRAKTEEKEAVLKGAKENAELATKNMKRLAELVDDPMVEAPDSTKATVKRNLERLADDIAKARQRYEDERKLGDVTERYWKKVQSARCNFSEELEILFPDTDFSKKRLSLKQEDLDLFLLHAYATVLYYQKEMYKAETISNTRLKYALDAAKKNDPDYPLMQIQVHEELLKEKRKLDIEHQRRCMAMRQEAERELRHRLKCQAEAHNDHLNERLAIREQELEREFNRRLDDELAREQIKYKTQLAGMIGRMKGMTNALQERIKSDRVAHQSQVLWSACQALHRAVKVSMPGVPAQQQIRPLKKEVEAIRKAAAEGDDLVNVVLSGIPTEAIERGVFPEDTIRERFLKVERVAKRLALVPEDGGRLPLYVLSYMQSMLLVNSANPIPQSELANEKTDFSKLDTFDILQRARYYLDRGNYAQTLRYMNLLKGASRCIADQWMKETRILLETQQAAEALMAHAVASGLQQF